MLVDIFMADAKAPVDNGVKERKKQAKLDVEECRKCLEPGKKRFCCKEYYCENCYCE